MSTSSPAEELKPTAGLRVRPTDDEHMDVWYLESEQWGTDGPSADQAIIDAAYINQLLEEAEQRNLHLKRPEDTGDLMVDLGDLTNARLGTMVQDEAFEMQVIDYIDTFNNAVIQGIPPFRAMRAMAHAFSVVIANCMRAGLHTQIAAAVLEGVIAATKAAGKHVKVITSSQRHN